MNQFEIDCRDSTRVGDVFCENEGRAEPFYT